MTLETTMRSNVVKALRRAGLDARPVENICDTGYPDVEYVGGTIELKAVDDWPKRPETPLRLEHYTQEQRIWQERRHAKGGRVHLLLQVGREFLLFWAIDAAAHLGNVPRAELEELACHRWPSLKSMSEGLPQALAEPR